MKFTEEKLEKAFIELLVRQAQLGASYKVKVFIGQSLTSSPYRVACAELGRSMRESWKQ